MHNLYCVLRFMEVFILHNTHAARTAIRQLEEPELLDTTSFLKYPPQMLWCRVERSTSEEDCSSICLVTIIIFHARSVVLVIPLRAMITIIVITSLAPTTAISETAFPILATSIFATLPTFRRLLTLAFAGISFCCSIVSRLLVARLVFGILLHQQAASINLCLMERRNGTMSIFCRGVGHHTHTSRPLILHPEEHEVFDSTDLFKNVVELVLFGVEVRPCEKYFTRLAVRQLRVDWLIESWSRPHRGSPDGTERA
mmetsp:Transcript_40173/g.63777  ORF Transcript_40173/g.63777 Transcript_40173/m.63777 type:complete len:256 (-) Transcript_40173:402-1169(-)